MQQERTAAGKNATIREREATERRENSRMSLLSVKAAIQLNMRAVANCIAITRCDKHINARGSRSARAADGAVDADSRL